MLEPLFGFARGRLVEPVAETAGVFCLALGLGERAQCVLAALHRVAEAEPFQVLGHGAGVLASERGGRRARFRDALRPEAGPPTALADRIGAAARFFAQAFEQVALFGFGERALDGLDFVAVFTDQLLELAGELVEAVVGLGRFARGCFRAHAGFHTSAARGRERGIGTAQARCQVTSSGFRLRQAVGVARAAHSSDVGPSHAADVAAEHAQLRELACAAVEGAERGVEPSKRGLAGFAFPRAFRRVRGFVGDVGEPLSDAARIAAGKAPQRDVDGEQHVLALARQRRALTRNVSPAPAFVR